MNEAFKTASADYETIATTAGNMRKKEEVFHGKRQQLPTKDLAFHIDAIEKIEKAGGTVTVLPGKISVEAKKREAKKQQAAK